MVASYLASTSHKRASKIARKRWKFRMEFIDSRSMVIWTNEERWRTAASCYATTANVMLNGRWNKIGSSIQQRIKWSARQPKSIPWMWRGVSFCEFRKLCSNDERIDDRESMTCTVPNADVSHFTSHKSEIWRNAAAVGYALRTVAKRYERNERFTFWNILFKYSCYFCYGIRASPTSIIRFGFNNGLSVRLLRH